MIIYDEDNATYHANTAIGSGDARAFLKSPQLFKDRQEGVVVTKESPAMRFGTLSHLAILEPERFKSVVVKPEGHDGRTTAGKAWVAANEGKQTMSEAEAAQLFHMQDRMPADIRAMLTSGKSEVTFRCGMPDLPVQCRADHWCEEANALYDLKTISDIEKIDHAIWDHGYHIQLAWYLAIIRAVTDEAHTAKLCFVETQAPYRWRCVTLSDDYLALGDMEVRRAVAGIQSRNQSGDWSDPAPTSIIAKPPGWATPSTTTGLIAKG